MSKRTGKGGGLGGGRVNLDQPLRAAGIPSHASLRPNLAPNPLLLIMYSTLSHAQSMYGLGRVERTGRVRKDEVV